MRDDDPDELGESHETWADMAELLGAVLTMGWNDERLRNVMRLMEKLDEKFETAHRKASSH